ncbi:SidA/IucD/PvdA family monooxygenase, partial [Micrococcus sp. SIMBA_144]
YMGRREDIAGAGSVLVVGSGQSAAECALDLLNAGHPDLTWVTRSPRFFGMEVGQLTLELTSLDYERHFATLPRARRDEINASHRSLYKGISEYTIEDVYHALYERQVGPLDPAR